MNSVPSRAQPGRSTVPFDGGDSVRLTSTDELVAYWQEHSDLPAAELEAAIPMTIDALYATRDAGGNMHSSAAACAVAALEAARTCR